MAFYLMILGSFVFFLFAVKDFLAQAGPVYLILATFGLMALVVIFLFRLIDLGMGIKTIRIAVGEALAGCSPKKTESL